MQSISIFDIFKIGVGPSSSHTLGPWQAARDFLTLFKELDFDRIKVDLYGSLSKTGRGHATDVAVQMGLAGYDPRTINTGRIQEYLEVIRSTETLVVLGKSIPFQPATDIVFQPKDHELHPNTVRFSTYQNGQLQRSMTYASIGGGFFERGEIGEDQTQEQLVQLPYPIQTAADLLEYTEEQDCQISDIVFRNERYFHDLRHIALQADAILDAMIRGVYRGCTTSGILPGGLQVKRRAKTMCADLSGRHHFEGLDDWIATIRASSPSFTQVNKWISCFALAVNEENAALGRVVTSPTNGAAGVIPAVLLYYYFFCEYGGKDKVRQFLFTAGEVGCLFKKGATISAAVGGCQAEIGVSSAMAAAGLTEVLGGTPKQALMAAEIAMEHHLGLTCDPIGGLVQIPCIERNAMGAIKAITAANLATSGDPDHAIVHLDTVIKTMWQTAQDMNKKYKETSEGGLAFHLSVIQPEC
ncbi:MAG: L-serine ammonia-lyase [Bacteroidota bacterium]